MKANGTAALAALMLSGCAQHGQTDALVTRDFMRQQFVDVRAPDLLAGSRCPESFAVSVRIEDPQPGLRYLAMMPTPLFVDSPAFEGMIKRYLEDVLRESRLRVQPTGGTPILVTVGDATVNTGWGPSAATLTISVSAPELGYSRQHVGRETSGTISRSIAYAIHEAVFDFVRSADAQSRMRCMTGSASLSSAPRAPSSQPAIGGPAAPAVPPIRQQDGPRAVGQESYQVARMPEVKACHPNPEPVLVSKSGAARETYAVACSSGSTITVSCEWGACRVAR